MTTTLMMDHYSLPYFGYMDTPHYKINLAWWKKHHSQDGLDWYIDERNQAWHDTYFAKQAIKDHQAKGNCRFAMLCLEYMESQGWLNKNDLILDPMCGIGSFLIVAALKGYNGIGVELEERYYNDMVGFEEGIDEGLFAGQSSHIEGSLEAFRKATETVANIGSIHVVNHDARDLVGALHKFAPNIQSTILASGLNDTKLMTVCSPPYGNRSTDETQQISSRKDHKGFVEFGDVDCSKRKQYSHDSANIGTKKIKVICSPPYTKKTEHSKKQVKSVEGYTGQKAHGYDSYRNIARLAESEYNIEMRKVYKSLYNILHPGSYVCLITRNFVQDLQVVFLDKLTTRMMKGAGFKYLTTKRAALPEISFFKRNNWIKHYERKKLPLIDWEEATFYVKE